MRPLRIDETNRFGRIVRKGQHQNPVKNVMEDAEEWGRKQTMYPWNK